MAKKSAPYADSYPKGVAVRTPCMISGRGLPKDRRRILAYRDPFPHEFVQDIGGQHDISDYDWQCPDPVIILKPL